MNHKTKNGGIVDISDTAFWAAILRALESERPDALFSDPFAKRLAGARGEAILDSIAGSRQAALPMAVRTQVLDEMLLRAVRKRGAESILNLAAGLDARPYRLDLPDAVEWIEVDKRNVIERKRRILPIEPPHGSIRRVSMNLLDRPARRLFFDRLSASGRPTIVVTEGLLIYLKTSEVKDLARDLLRNEHFRWWLLDFASPEVIRKLKANLGSRFESAGARFRFAPKNGTTFFLEQGWRPVETSFGADDARRLNREAPLASFYRRIELSATKARRESTRRHNTCVLLERA